MEGLTIKSDRRYTYADYLKMDDDRDYEVVGGKLIMVPRPRPRHQKIVGRFFTVLENYFRQTAAGEVYIDVDVLLGDQVVSPDLVVVLKERLSIVQETNISGAPDLVVEILSPSTAKYDRKEKSQLYYDSGVQEYWLVDPSLQLIEVYERGEKNWNRSGIYDEEDTLVSPLLPGLQAALRDIFTG